MNPMTTITPPPVQPSPDYQGEPAQPPAPPQKRSRKLAVLTGIVALVAGAGIAGAVGGHHGSPAAAPSPAASVSAPATSAPPASAPAPALAQQELGWANGGGLTNMSTLEGDMGSIVNFAGQQNLPALEGEGGTLTQDATTALNDPPPVDPADYSTAMTDWAQAGTDLTGGDIPGATAALDAGNSAFSTWSAQAHANGS